MNETPEPAGVHWKPEMIFVITGFGVEYATRLSRASCFAPAAPPTAAAATAVAINRTSIVRLPIKNPSC